MLKSLLKSLLPNPIYFSSLAHSLSGAFPAVRAVAPVTKRIPCALVLLFGGITQYQ